MLDHLIDTEIKFTRKELKQVTARALAAGISRDAFLRQATESFCNGRHPVPVGQVPFFHHAPIIKD